MKKLTEKNVVQKIIISILIVLSFNFVVPTFSRADFGGMLLSPVVSLIGTVCDAVVAGLQFFMYDGGTSGGDGIWGGFTVPAEYFNKNPEQFPDMQYDDSGNNVKYEPDIKASDLDRGFAEAALSAIAGFFGGGPVNADNFGIPISKYSPEKIFSGKVPSLDVNFISPKFQKTADGGYPAFVDSDGDGLDDNTGAATEEQHKAMIDRSITSVLQTTIASWYVALRNLAIVGLLSVLLYVGIRMIISSTAADKAKYKQMLMDWVIALCLVFFLHYIMSFVLTMTDMIVDGIGSSNQIAVKVVTSKEDSTEVASFNTDLMGLCRFLMNDSNMGNRLIYMIMYIALTVYTVVFTWKYVKRAITMAFLTLMAPIVSLTYPIDKINDGKAQAFNMWLKEYVFNALLQPFHLIIYTVFLGSSMEIAVKNPIFAILFLAFIGPAEKLLKKFFGFDKASTVGALDSASKMFGGAAAFKMLSNMATKRGGKSGSGGKKDNIRTQRNPEVQASNGPRGYDGYTGIGGTDASDGGNNLPAGPTEFEDISSSSTSPQAQLDAYDEGYGTNDWNAGERDAMARQANFGNENNLTDSDEERAQIMRDSGYTDDEIAAYFGNTGRNVNPPDSANSGNNIRFADNGQDSQPVNDSGDNMQMPPEVNTPTPQMPNNTVPNTTVAAPNSETRRERAIRGLKNKASTVMHDKLGNTQWWGQKGRQVAGLAGRAAVRTVTAGLGAAVGVGLGMAGDDLEDVLTYGAAGAALGASTGGNMALKGTRAIGSQASDIWHGSHEEAELARQARANVSDNSFRNNIQTNYQPGGKELQGNELTKATRRAAEYYNQGITNNKTITKTMKLEDSINKELANDQNLNWSEEQKQQFAKEKAIVAAKWAEKVSDAELRDSKKQASLQASFERGIQAKGLSKKDAEKNAKELIANIKQIKGID